MEPGKLAHELEQRGLDWADKDAAFKALDDVTKTMLSECIADLNEKPKSMAEAEVKARRSPKYTAHLKALGDARREANRARVNYDTYKVYLEMIRTAEATNRAQMGMR